MSLTIRSTTTGVLPFFTSMKSSVRAAFARACSSTGSTFFSACTTSLARLSSSFKKSKLWSRPCSCLSLSFSRRSPSCTNCGFPACLRSLAISLISISLDLFSGSLASRRPSNTSASKTKVSMSSRMVSKCTFSWTSSIVLAPRACQSRLPLPLGGFTDS